MTQDLDSSVEDEINGELREDENHLADSLDFGSNEDIGKIILKYEKMLNLNVESDDILDESDLIKEEMEGISREEEEDSVVEDYLKSHWVDNSDEKDDKTL